MNEFLDKLISSETELWYLAGPGSRDRSLWGSWVDLHISAIRRFSWIILDPNDKMGAQKYGIWTWWGLQTAGDHCDMKTCCILSWRIRWHMNLHRRRSTNLDTPSAFLVLWKLSGMTRQEVPINLSTHLVTNPALPWLQEWSDANTDKASQGEHRMSWFSAWLPEQCSSRSYETTWKRTYSCARPFRTVVFHREKGPRSTQTSRNFLNGGTKSFSISSVHVPGCILVRFWLPLRSLRVFDPICYPFRSF